MRPPGSAEWRIIRGACVGACRPVIPALPAPSLPTPPVLQVLLVIAATHLDAVAFQIFGQSFKLVPTALFAYWLLGQALEPMQVGGAVRQ